MNGPPGADRHTLDLAIIGAGPAGLAAAVTASELGLATAVFDEQFHPGGQIYRAIEDAPERAGAWLTLFGEDYARGLELVRRFRASTANYHTGHSVFDISPGGGLGVLGPDGARWIEARRVIIATGAMERPVAVPDWTLPGVMGAGAAQTLLKGAAMVPEGRTVIAGSGPLIYLVARQLRAAGGNIVAVIDTTPRSNYRRAAPLLARAMLAGNKEIRKGLSWRRDLKKATPIFRTGASGVRIEGRDAVEAISFSVAGRTERVECDLVLLHEGVVPNTQLAMAAGADHHYDLVQACWRPKTDAYGRSSDPAILIAGDGAGIGGAELASEAGHLAALGVAADLSQISQEDAAERAAPAFSKLAGKAALRRFLDTLYQPRDEVLVPPDDETLICRCEEVTAGELRRVAEMGCSGPNQAKAFTRCGMGPCQGRMCGLAAAAVLARASGRSFAEVGHMRVRPPIKPITVGELAALDGVGQPPDMGPLLPTGQEDGAGE